MVDMKQCGMCWRDGEKGEIQLKECCQVQNAQSNVCCAYREKMEVDRNHIIIFWKISISLPEVFVYFLHSARHGVISGGIPERLLQAR